MAAKRSKTPKKSTPSAKANKSAQSASNTQARPAAPDPGKDEAVLPRMGRPPKLENTEFVRNIIFNLGKMQCTQEEAAATLGVSKPTFTAFLAKFPEVDDAWKMGPFAGKASLRQRQWASAQKGNVQMQKWLGKQYLGQSEKVDLRGPNGGEMKVRTLADFYGAQRQS